MKQDSTQVIIVGGGITGLTAALYLGQQGVSFILIEKHRGTSIHPRARTIDTRTMELYRGLGLSEALREGGKALAPAWGILRGTNLVETLATTQSDVIGKANFPKTFAAMKALAEKSPESVCRCTQDISEAIIYARAVQHGLDLRFNHELQAFQQDTDRVEVLVKNRETEEVYAIHAQYMIAADGANSFVRKQLDIPCTGHGAWMDLLNIYFEADLGALVKGREFSQFLVDTPEITGFLLAINNTDRWTFHLHRPKEQAIEEILRKVIGIPDLKVTVLSTLPWQLTVRIAAQLRVNRIFIAGDAAHTMTPYAGKGASAGVQDVHNLAWKLAAVLRHQAGDALLDTYQTERQPVGAFYANLSGEMAGRNGLIDESKLLQYGEKLLGLPDYGYQSTAVVRPSDAAFNFFKGEPGTCIPHMWLDEARTQSTLDWIKGQFVLVANGHFEYWDSACKMAPGVRLVRLPANEEWMSLTQTTPTDALLIRPDDFVAARLNILQPYQQLSATLLKVCGA
ncbi:FAD-dependent oxidoreductase [Chitinophaga silvisoli]|uniref:FAD-dependent oxidoreductase n=1 Tax=Chitinophaga silvisoli TaxID=2291814 RepID=A0A3E1NX81_9BACT|nr:FAD-dependent oxidoreductase [Chitinophaga silvisoli]RFM32531.1 FAD-dependent oxidoreductase [Chitinophaga silvisoli]